MGQESSQIEGEARDNEGVIIKVDPEEKENGNIRNVSNWNGSTANEGSPRTGTMKPPKARKKKSKRWASPSSSGGTFETARDGLENRSVDMGRGTPDLPQRSRDAALTPSSMSINQKVAETEAKKRRLLAMISAAAGNTDSNYPGQEGNEDSTDQHDHFNQEHGFQKVQKVHSPNFAKPQKRLNKPEMTFKKSNSDNVNGRLTPEATQGGEVSPAGKILKNKKSQSRLHSASSITEAKKNQQFANAHLATLSGSSQVLRRQLLEDPFTTQNISESDSQTTNNKHKSKQGSKLAASSLSTKKHRSRKSVTNDSTSDEADSSDESTSHEADSVSNKQGPQRSSLTLDQPTNMSTFNNHSFSQDMDVIDPALRDVGYAPDTRPLQIGIYKNFATPQTTGKRKRRLPTDEDDPEEIFGSEPKTKKPRKSLIKPKTANQQGHKPNTPRFREASPDLDLPSTKTQSRKSTKLSSDSHNPVTKGKFTPRELEIMQQEKIKYQEMTGMTAFSLNEIVQDTPGKLSGLWDEICAALPDRQRQAIVKVCRRKFHNFGVRGKWTKEEDADLKEAYERYPKRWKQIGQMLNRHHEDVRDRWRNYLVCGDNMKRESWTEEEEENLRAIVGECIQAVRKLRAAEIAQNGCMANDPRPDIELVDWQIVSEKFGRTRSRLQCLDKWNRIARLEDSEGDAKELSLGPRSWRVKTAKKDVKHMRREDYLELLIALRNTHAGREGKVNWGKLGDMDLRIKWTCMARKVAWKKLRASVPGNEDMKFQDIVTLLLNNLPKNDAELEGIYGVVYADAGSPVEEAVPSPQRRPLSEAISSADEAEVEDANIDPNLNELGSGDVDEEHAQEHRGSFSRDVQHHSSNQDLLREVIGEGYYESGEGGNEVEDGDIAMALADHGSVDLDQTDYEDEVGNGTSRLRSPISFKPDSNLEEAGYVDSQTDSSEVDADMDIPARRPARRPRLDSVDLDMN